MGKLDIDKSKNIPGNLSNLKSKVDKLDVDRLVPVPVDLSKLSDVVKYVVKKDVNNAMIKNIEGKISDIINLSTNTTLNAKINEVKNGIPSITGLATIASLNAKINEVKVAIPTIANVATTSAYTTVENKIPNVSDLVKKADYEEEIKCIKNKCFIRSDYNKFTNNIFDEKITVKKLVNESELNENVNT